MLASPGKLSERTSITLFVGKNVAFRRDVRGVVSTIHRYARLFRPFRVYRFLAVRFRRAALVTATAGASLAAAASGLETVAAAAAGNRIGVVHCESGAHQTIHVVYFAGR